MGLASQRHMHAESIHNARQSLKHMKELCRMGYNYHQLTQMNNIHVRMLMQELSCIDDELTHQDIHALREQLSRLRRG